MKKFIAILAVFVVGFLGIHQSATAQDTPDRKVVQLSGVILNADSTTAIPGVNIYVPKKGRGTSSNRFGYFSMPVVAGDSVVFSYIGLKRQTLKIPADITEDKVSYILTMIQDEIALQEVKVMPYPTEEEFKNAILAVNVDAEPPLNRGNLSPQLLLKWAEEMPASGNENFRQFTNQQTQQTLDRYGPRPLPLLNPFAWAQFIKSIKNGDLKNRD
ncbi:MULTISPECIES: carboxypeptidase-like regulatory domain-containing protein [Cyclobacterium]|uniref:Carboxypeptidase-like regulatory domain-containing protein n=1 Tax=Cyclobacterium plantarum TaxID=2716263 RepID=A0ABX0H4L8_9BACT|nr:MULTISPECIES: carboxypeptidase-like regulatory domain-containing protein [Cyclobacterium]MBD3629242.1 carboxypeptidase-like regulatory domain-containing protein [Cyclobacterium sp.]NHE55323.1 carboxypeptidase-like regulatory domain-containing protein [Cyclobacterium plantarum]